MPKPERFDYYTRLLRHLTARVPVKDFFLDIGCKFKIGWFRAADALQQRDRLSRILVGWWHAAGHGADCYLQNSGMYTEGGLAGWAG